MHGCAHAWVFLLEYCELSVCFVNDYPCTYYTIFSIAHCHTESMENISESLTLRTYSCDLLQRQQTHLRDARII